ncbi:hypothetical protein PUN28_009006 [Cardiocondyla obscurior]|uniref:Uncharacterized protein n=1 Tax=Cardiocondyla obscurior TaxID=286306 RepID=A0AAW2FQF6_9HYME
MAESALEEKINKIRQQNEEIRRRHEEVEEDKKNAAKLNALVQMVPSTDWPERKEPPEFSNPPRTNNKSKPAKEHHEHSQQYQSSSNEGRKVFAQGQGPPPDPKYNFLADAEREEGERENIKDTSNRGQKYSRGMFRKKSGAKDGMQRDYRTNRGSHRDDHQPEYDAWRAERNRIDEDRISRQRTAEGNWRREWDNDKAHIVDEVTRSEGKLGDYVKKDYKDFDRRYHVNGNDYASHNRGGHRSYRGNSRHFHNNYENSSNSYYQDGHNKNLSDKRTVIATDKSIKVTLNQGNMSKGPVMSVKVNSPSIAGTGRVGPRQRSRITYSSHADVETSLDTESFSRSKSYEDKTKNVYQENLHKSSNSRKSQLPPKKKDFSNKSPFFRKKEMIKQEDESSKYHEIESSQKEYEESQQIQSKVEKPEEDVTIKSLQDDKIVTANENESNIISSEESNTSNIEVTDKNDQNLNLHMNEKSEIDAAKKNELDLNLSVSEINTEIETCKKTEQPGDKLDESLNVQAVVTIECETAATKLTESTVKLDNDENVTKYVEQSSCDTDKKICIEETVMENKNYNSERTEKILSDNCDNKQTKDASEPENDIDHDTKISPNEEEKEKEDNDVMASSLTNIHYITEQNNELKNEDEVLEKKENLAVETKTAITIEKSNTSDIQDVTECINETEEHTVNNEREINVENNIDKIESLKEDLHLDKEKAAISD